jgi:spermidine/putrescine transport system permease protein
MSARSIRAKLSPYALIFPAWIWLVIFFVVPVVTMLSVSLMTGSDVQGFTQTWHWSTYSDAWDKYHVQIVRSLVYGLIATGICLVLAYPVAYWIAFRVRPRYKASILFLLLLPFFVSFVIRTQTWGYMLADQGIVLDALRWLHLADHNTRILNTSTAVIGGLSYNFLPFTILPIYVSLERVTPDLLEAASDLYANKVLSFLRVVLPLSVPGVFAAVLLTFVPVSADFVNAQLLGGTSNHMVGNAIETEYMTNFNPPTASALSFILMAVLLVGVFAYARALGTEEAMEMAATA